MAWLLKDYNFLSAAIILLAVAILICVLIYKQNIGNLIDRLYKPEVDTRHVVPQGDSQRSAVVRAAPNIESESHAAVTLAKRIQDDMSVAPVSNEEKIRLTALLAANNILRAEFELKFRLMYGSQYEALAGLRQKGPHSLETYYRTFLERVEARKAEVEAAGLQTGFEAWVGFLTIPNSPYLVLDGGIARITELGDAFMEYSVRTAKMRRDL